MEVGAGLITEYTYDADKNVISQRTVMMGADTFLGVSDLQGANSLQREIQGADSLQKAIPGITKANGIDNLVVSGGKTISSSLGNAENDNYCSNAQFLAGNLTSIIAMNQRDRSKPYTLVDNTYAYDANGNRTSKQTLAGLYYLRARFYNPVIGRFIQEDTYYGDGLNLYTYCQNNPVKYIDPSGHDACLQKQEAINKLKEAGLSPEDAENYYNHLRESNGVDATVEQIKKDFGNQSGKTSTGYKY